MKSKNDIEDVSTYQHFCTVGDLLNFIEKHNISKDSKILVQRVEDQYYEGVDISGMRGSGGILPEGSMSNGWSTVKKNQDNMIVEYSPVWCPLKYEDDKHLYLDLHY